MASKLVTALQAEVSPSAISANAQIPELAVALKKAKKLVGDHNFDGPILPKKMIWTASSIKQFRQCPRKFYWKYIMRLRQRFSGTPLIIGTAFHECLAKWYSSTKNSMDKLVVPALAKLNQYIAENSEFYDDEEQQNLRAAVASFHGMLTGYAAVNAKDRKTWKFDRLFGTEHEFIIDCGDFYYAGSIDGLPTIKGKQWVLEHKTASTISDSYIQRVQLDTQSRGYMFAVMAITGKKPVGTIYNVTAKCKLRRKSDESWAQFNQRIFDAYMNEPEKYFWRDYIQFTADDLMNFATEIYQTHRMFRLVAETMGGTDPKVWPINDHHCNEYFKMCEFHGLCTTGLDHGTAMQLEQLEKMHAELGESNETADRP